MDLRRIELRHLRYFLAVSEELHFTRAAQRLGIAQPPLSQQIQRLEDLLGVKLLQRRPRLVLTAAGEQLAAIARESLERVSNGLERVRDVAAGRAGTLRLGFASSTLLNVLPRLVRRYRADRPGVKLQLTALASPRLIQDLSRGMLDAAVIRHPVVAGLRCVIVHSESFLVVMPRSHPLAGSGRIHLQRLNDEPYVDFPRQFAPYLHDQIEDLWRRSRTRPRVVQEAAEWLTIVGLVESGLGVSVVPASFAKLRWGDVVYCEIEGRPMHTVTTACVRDQGNSAAAQAFVEEAERLANA